MSRSLHGRLIAGAILLPGLIVAGTLGYVLIEGWSLLDATYQTVTTLSTVGFREVHDLSDAGRVFTMLLIVFGVGTMLYTVTVAAESVIEGGVLDALGVRRQQAMIEKLKDHFILCGAGRVGLEIAHEFAQHGVPFVVIDPGEHAQETVGKLGHLLISGDATAEETLLAAGVQRARVLVAAVNGDADNTFITLTARALNPGLHIVARADATTAEARLRQAGADRVISPLAVGGRRMALSALRPAMVDFMDTLLGRREEGILAEIQVTERSDLDGARLADVLSTTPSIRVLALQDGDGALKIGPPDDVRLPVGARLFVLGDQAEIERLTANTGGQP